MRYLPVYITFGGGDFVCHPYIRLSMDVHACLCGGMYVCKSRDCSIFAALIDVVSPKRPRPCCRRQRRMDIIPGEDVTITFHRPDLTLCMYVCEASDRGFLFVSLWSLRASIGLVPCVMVSRSIVVHWDGAWSASHQWSAVLVSSRRCCVPFVRRDSFLALHYLSPRHVSARCTLPYPDLP
jgi:hypothetical protein